MRAAVLTSTGSPDVLVVQDVPDPTPATGEVLVQVEAAGVHFVETQMRGGVFPMPTPFVFGTQAAGVIVAVGEGVDEDWLNTRVVVAVQTGAYAQYVVAAAENVTPIPDEVSTNDALAVLMQGSVALALLDSARLQSGEVVAIEAAATGIGGYLTQLVKQSDAGLILGTTSAGRMEQAAKLGANHVVDHTAEWQFHAAQLLDGRTVDVVFESMGGESALGWLGLMTPLAGRMLCYGLRSGTPAAIAVPNLLAQGLTVAGCGGLAWQARVETFRLQALEYVATGRLTPLIDVSLPLEEAAEAHRRIETRQANGMVILTP